QNAGGNGAGWGADVRIDVNRRREQGQFRARRQFQRLVQGNGLLRPQFQLAQAAAVQPVAGQGQDGLAVFADLLVQVGQDALVFFLYPDLLEYRRYASGRESDSQPRSPRDGGLGLQVAVQTRLRGLDLARALVDFPNQVAIQQSILCRDDQFARVPAYGVAGFEAGARADQGVVEGARGLFAPARVQGFPALVYALVQQVAGGAAGFVQAAVFAAQPGQVNLAGLHVQCAAGQVQARPGFGHEVLAGGGNGAALGQPFAYAVRGGIQVAADFQQTAGRVPTVGLVALRALGHEDQQAAVHPDVFVVQVLAVAVDGRVALFIALGVDQQLVA